MPDQQIHPIGDEAAPADYVIPPSAELLLKGVYASFDGSGAAGAFKPLVRIVSDAGSTVLEAVADSEVPAGASVDVSWFPRVGSAAQAAGGAVVSAHVHASGFTSFPAGSNHGMDFTPATFGTNDAATFSMVDDATMGLTHGGFLRCDWAGEFSTTAGTPYSGLFTVAFNIFDSIGGQVDEFTGPVVYYSQLYATDGGDDFQLGGTCTFGADDGFYTPPYTVNAFLSNDTAVTFVGYEMVVSILNPQGFI